MKNFIFKSPPDFHKIIFNKLEVILAEQRKQRMDLAEILRLLMRDKIDDNLQHQVDKYFDEDQEPEIDESETSPQTDQSTKAE